MNEQEWKEERRRFFDNSGLRQGIYKNVTPEQWEQHREEMVEIDWQKELDYRKGVSEWRHRLTLKQIEGCITNVLQNNPNISIGKPRDFPNGAREYNYFIEGELLLIHFLNPFGDEEWQIKTQLPPRSSSNQQELSTWLQQLIDHEIDQLAFKKSVIARKTAEKQEGDSKVDSSIISNQSPLAAATPHPPLINKVELSKLIRRHYDLGEFKSLCFELQVAYDDLPGETLTNRVEALVEYLERRGRVPELLTLAKQERPHIPWPDTISD